MRGWVLGLGAILVAASSSAAAQQGGEPPSGSGSSEPAGGSTQAPPETGGQLPPVEEVPPAPAEPETAEAAAPAPESGLGGWLDEHGMRLMAALGVVSMVNEHARDFIGPGASWDVRVLVGARTRVGYELAYTGSAAGIQAPGLDTGAIVVSNGLQGAVRLNATTTSAWQPYVLAGAGWRHYAVTHAAFNDSLLVNGSDNVLELPLAAGITWRTTGKLVVDGRFSYRVATGEDLLGGRPGGGPGLSNWVLALSAGLEL